MPEVVYICSRFVYGYIATDFFFPAVLLAHLCAVFTKKDTQSWARTIVSRSSDNIYYVISRHAIVSRWYPELPWYG